MPAPVAPALRACLLLLGLLALTPDSGAAPPPADGPVGHPLAVRSGPRGATLFVEVSPDTSGLKTENRYADPSMWNQRYHEFELGPIGTGVTIGDYDGDARPDIFVVSKTESCRLFRNLGGWRFEDVSDRAGVSDRGDAAQIWKQGASFADVNNDGRLDLYVCRFDAPNLLYINQGDGTFRESAREYGLDVRDGSLMAAFCDFDRDGWLDVFIQTNLLSNAASPGGQRDRLFHNERNGSFRDVTASAGLEPVETQGNSATWWDYDQDGWPDLYVANDFAAPDQLYRNNRDGTFTNLIAVHLPHTPYSAMGADLGDINNDGWIDFFVADMAATSHQKDQRSMADTRARAKDPSDAETDVRQAPYNALFLNTGAGRAQEVAHLAGLAATDWTWSPRFEDLDNDGWLDLHVTNGMHREIHNVDLILRMMGAESAEERVRIVRNSPVLAEANLAFRNHGDLRFEPVGEAWGLAHKGVSFGSAFGDLDGDGDLDLVYTNYLAGATLLRNDSDSGHRLVLELRGTRSNRFGVGAWVQIETETGLQTRQLTLARGYMSASEPILHFGLGDATQVRRLTVRWPSGHVQTFEDLAADRRYTITEPAGRPPSERVAAELQPAAMKSAPPPRFHDIAQSFHLAALSREEPFDELAQAPLLPFRFNRRGPALAVGVFGPDGAEDLVIGGTTRTPIRLLRSSTATSRAAAPNPAPSRRSDALPDVTHPALNDGPVLAFDANGDGSTDVLVTRGGVSQPAGTPAYQPLLMLGDGHGGFRPAPDGTLPALSLCVGAAVAADFNRDGRVDLFLGGRVTPGGYPASPDSALLLNRDGHFEDVTEERGASLRRIGMVTGALWSDADADGWVDLLLTLDWGRVTYFRNIGGKRFEDQTEAAGFAAAGTGWWTGLTAADFNGDGHPDYVAGNLGLNTPYHAAPGRPALLYVGAFRGGNTARQPVEAYFEGGTLYPRRTRRELGAVVPALLRRFPRNDVFAQTPLPDLLGGEALATAERYTATELRSGVFLSQADGTFRFTPLPRIAQIAPVQGMVAGDFDGDGRADLYVVQNSFAAHPATGRFDGGVSQLLRGDGTGRLVPIPARESGLVVAGDAKALVQVDLDQDGWPDFVGTRNNGSTVAFRNAGAAGVAMLAVRLQGRAGNPTAIGARVTAEHVDGRKQSAEVYAGSGYFSQSSPRLFFGADEKNAIHTITVRWPDGTTKAYAVASAKGTITLAE